MRKIFLCLSAVSVIASSTVSMAFSDVVDTHWAKKSIDSMVEKGIISGYTDGTFKPSRNITKIESLILFSKIAGVNKYTEEANEYEKIYSSKLSSYDTAYKKQVCFLLGTGVLDEDDLPNLLSKDKINSPMMREEMAVLITKILGKEEEVTKKSFFILPFSDASSITASAKPYVEFVYNEGIMKGVTEDTFSPKTYVTRAQAAIILNDIIDKVNIVPKIEKDTDNKETNSNINTTTVTLTLSRGSITSIDTMLSTIEIGDDIYEYDEKTVFYVDGKTSDEYDIEEDMKVNKATIKAGKLTLLDVEEAEKEDDEDDEDEDEKDKTDDDIEIDETTGIVVGDIVSINIAEEKVLTLKVGKKEKAYYLTSDTNYYKDNVKVTMCDFEVDDEVTITVDDGVVTKMVYGEQEESEAYVIGTITTIDTESKKIKVKLDNGETKTVTLASSYKILDSSNASTMKISKLEKGDNVIIVGKYKSSKFVASVIVLYYE